jgi:glycosyltransferase involved in cell wall biosynthesis
MKTFKNKINRPVSATLAMGGELIKHRLHSLLKKGKAILRRFRSRGPDTAAPYAVKQQETASPSAPRVTHIIANFMTGGSSRLVVDLIEHLGGNYRQNVMTRHIPDPPAYVGLEIEEYRYPVDEKPFAAFFQRTRTDFVHVHYWENRDEPWYHKAIRAAEILGLPVIENINTPVAPYLSDAVVRYVYVSDFVRQTYGENGARHVTIYPGSDFFLFDRDDSETLPEDCVGMVYRLENDKLSPEAIEPFIRIARKRPQTRILIVGGGSLLAVFQQAVTEARVADRFEFTGYVGYEQLPGLYRRLSVFIAPVRQESFGQVSPFAMNMHIPVIGYDTGALSEIIDDPQLLAPPGDAERLAGIALALLDDPELRERIGRRLRERARKYFSVQAMIKSYAELYAEIGRTLCKESP